ncbi:hypothetical protein PF003_g39914 [Phytophthora fragariae]|nr:hypothetical protein PF003_g39914 [Phytophthora fragariae]
MAPRRTQRSQQEHQQFMLALLDEREVERRAEYAEFPRQPPSDDDADTQASPCPIIDSWYNEGGAEAVRRLTNFSPREFNRLWGSVRPHVTRYWNVGRGRRSALAGKDVFFMTLSVLKHGGTWDMNAAIFCVKTPMFIKTITAFLHVLAPRMYDDWVRAKADETTMRNLVTSGRTFPNFPCALYATDVTFQHSNRPAGSMAEVMPFYSGKHKLYGLKVEVSVNPRGVAINCSDHARGNTPDITMFRNNTEFHDAIRLKSESDLNLADGGPLKETFADEWALLADKGYQGLGDQKRCIHPKKGRNLSRADQQFNDEVSSDRVIVENFFGRLCTLWRVCADKYRWSEELYDDIFQISVGLTNFHIEYNPLREHNAEEYAQREHRMLAIGKEKARKRRLSQEKYRRRKQMRHRMSLDDLPRHHDADVDSDATQM